MPSKTEQFATENLVLLEFLVEEIHLQQIFDLQIMLCETLVSFQFLDNAPLFVTEEDVLLKEPDCRNICKKSNVKIGKSCLFSLTPSQADYAAREFDIWVDVHKKMKPGTLPDKMRLGGCKISVAELFKDLMSDVVEMGDATSAKTLKNSYLLTGPTKEREIVGDIRVFLRMSCFGKLIVTQFQMNLEKKSVEFKAKEGHYKFKYDKKDARCDPCCGSKPPAPPLPPPPAQQQAIEIPSPLEEPPCPPYCPSPCYPPPPCCPSPCYPSPPCPTPCCSPPECCLPAECCPAPPCMPPPCTPCVPCEPCEPCRPCWPCQPCPPSPPCLPCSPCSPCSPCPPCDPCKPPCPLPYSCNSCFQEIGASMGMNSLTIRVHKDTYKQVTNNNNDDDTIMEDSYCICPAKRGKKNKKKKKCPKPRCPALTCCPEYPSPSCPPPPCCSPCCTPSPSPEAKSCDDPNRERFVLNIGKKVEGCCCKRNDLEIEVCTPKGKDIKPNPQKCSADTQYSLLDLPEGYLEKFYGPEKWKQMQKAQQEEEEKLARMYGNYDGSAVTYSGKVNGKNGKNGDGKGGKDGKSGKGKGATGGKDGKGGKGGKDSTGGRDGGGNGGKDNKNQRRAGTGGGVPMVYFDKTPPCYAGPCMPCRPCGPCGPCGPCRPCTPCFSCVSSCYTGSYCF